MAWGTDTYRMLLAIKRKDLKHAEFKKIFSVIHYLEKQPEQMAQRCNPIIH